MRFVELFDESPGLAPLRDAAVFKQAMLADDGWTVDWVAQDIQIGADTLWLDAQAQNTTDDNARIFALWRARNGLTLAAAALALEMTPRTLSAYGTGARPVPRAMWPWPARAGSLSASATLKPVSVRAENARWET